MLNNFFGSIESFLVSLLRPFAGWLLDVMLLVPLGAVRLLFLGVLAALALWALSLPPQLPDSVEGEPKKKPKIWDDLRYCAVGLLLFQSIFYLIF